MSWKRYNVHLHDRTPVEILSGTLLIVYGDKHEYYLYAFQQCAGASPTMS